MNTGATSLALVALLLVVPACKKKGLPSDITREEAKRRAAPFEPQFAIVKKLPASPPPITRVFMEPGVQLSVNDPIGDNGPHPYLVIHAEDLAAPPKYWANEAVKARIGGSGALSGCASGLAEVNDPQTERFSEYTLLPCTGFKHAFVIRTTSYTAPKVTGSDEEKSGGTRKITEHFSSGKVVAEVTVYDLTDGHPVGGFRYEAESSETPSMEGGAVGALDRDLTKNAQEAIRNAFYAALKGGPAAPPAGKPAPPAAKPAKKN